MGQGQSFGKETDNGVWMIVQGPKDYEMYFGKYAPTERKNIPLAAGGYFQTKGGQTAHMKMQEELPLEVIDKVICAGSIQNVQKGNNKICWNSLYNNPEFRNYMNDEHRPRPGAVHAGKRHIKEQQHFRDELKKRTPNTPCSEEHQRLAEKLYAKKRVKIMWPNGINPNLADMYARGPDYSGTHPGATRQGFMH